ncbi:osmotically inducible protein OsmC [Salegentibacter salinarum]|uniref:Osmotically inducible protein OsmC n=1 Tax=Salegentibacter salinarum TaxID=447422 RepID=A0A2N0TST9_9FLAO|nr:OsmC family protein [Salegentibacter salinarum]PKD17810.1 osmotically inducible protein OsmC [Salegentibacter salinarum]SKC01405.1 peroxiredoxin, SACOL1771 subfamily [Salegentibacter salinarum]
MAEKHEYQVDLTWVEDRKGEVSSPELTDTIETATPPDFPKGMPNIWSPEHFLVAAVESCLMTTFLAIAENSKLDFISFKSKAIGKLDKVEGKFQMTEIILKPVLKIADESNAERAKRILEKSEKACLISNSIKSKIILEAEVVIVSQEKV